MPTKAELEEELSAAQKRIAKFEKATADAKPKSGKASIDGLEEMTAELVKEAEANPGNGRVLWHLKNIESELDSLHQAAETEARMERPEGE